MQRLCGCWDCRFSSERDREQEQSETRLPLTGRFVHNPSMQSHEFQLRPNQDFIELHKLLKFMGIAESGATAKALVASGEVMVDGAVELRKACKIRAGRVVQTGDARIVVEAGAIQIDLRPTGSSLT